MLTPTPQPDIKPASRPEERLVGPLTVATIDTPEGTRVMDASGQRGTVVGRDRDPREAGLPEVEVYRA